MARRLTVKDKIDRFVKKHPEPIMPTTCLYWNRKDGRHYHKIGNGTIQIYTPLGNKVLFQYYKADEKLGLCELSIVTIDDSKHVPKQGDQRKWVYAYRYFLPKGTRDLYDINGQQGRYPYERVSYNWTAYSSAEFGRHLSRLKRVNYAFENEFLKFIGDDIKTASTWQEYIIAPWGLEAWFKYKNKTKTTGGVQKTIDILTKKELPSIDINFLIDHYESINNQRLYWYSNHSYAYFDKDNMVFRCFYKLDNQIIENRRVYYYNKKFYACIYTKNYGWVTNGSFTNNQFRYRILNLDDVYYIPHTEYLKPLIKIPSTVYQVVSIMKNPEIEQLVNMNLHNIAIKIAGYDYKQAALKDMFGKPNKGKNFCKKYGISSKQLQHINQHINDASYYNQDIIKRIKVITGISNVASIDYDTFIKYYDVISNMNTWDWRTIRIICQEPQKVLLDRLVKWYAVDTNAVGIFKDTINSYNSLNRDNKPETSPDNVKTYDELVRLHDTCVELKRIQDEERRRLWNMQEAERNAELEKKMTKLNEERRKLNYEEDDYLIRVPEKLAEITNEGSRLHHCVGSYVSQHANGTTTIIFLRKKSDPDTSFYTIEINNGRVIQIHGFANKWLGNDPDAIPTVMRWLKMHNISCTDQILLSTAKGYFNNNATLVAKPVI